MESPELYIPPCCIHRQLPDLIRQGGAFSVFYSQGDWGLPKLTFAVERLVSSQDEQVVTILVLPDVTLDTVRYLERELRMHWSSAIILITATDQTELIRSNLQPDHLSHLTYCPGRPEAEHSNLWLRQSSRQHMLILGPLTPDDAGPRRVSAYTASYGDSEPGATSNSSLLIPHSSLKSAFLPWRSMVRLHATIRSSDPLLDAWLK